MNKFLYRLIKEKKEKLYINVKGKKVKKVNVADLEKWVSSTQNTLGQAERIDLPHQ